ncbi:MAG: helix-turn-helix domain-containing protein [Bacteroidota bacterium]
MSLGNDLATIRKAKNLTLEDIQSLIKIPVSTLKEIESGSIFDGLDQNKTYIRSYVRSYARVLKIPEQIMIDALDAFEADLYNGELLEQNNEPAPEPRKVIESVAPSYAEETAASKPLPGSSAPSVDAVDWANMGHRFNTQTKNPKARVIVLVAVLVIIVAALGIYFGRGLLGFGEEAGLSEQTTRQDTNLNEPVVQTPETATPNETEEEGNNNSSANEDDARLENEDASTQNEPAPIISTAVPTQSLSNLPDTLTVTVYAARGQLTPVRITSDYNGRTNPFWMEQGEAYNFDFQDTLLIRGQYSRMLLLFNGHVVEDLRRDFFNPAFNSVMLTRSFFEDDRFLQSAPPFPYEMGAPDSIVYRIRF